VPVLPLPSKLSRVHLSARQPLHLNLTLSARPPPSLTPITQHRFPQNAVALVAQTDSPKLTPERRTDRARPVASERQAAHNKADAA
jgi:hypothetical protein